jgi:hypothetical protein
MLSNSKFQILLQERNTKAIMANGKMLRTRHCFPFLVLLPDEVNIACLITIYYHHDILTIYDNEGVAISWASSTLQTEKERNRPWPPAVAHQGWIVGTELQHEPYEGK